MRSPTPPPDQEQCLRALLKASTPDAFSQFYDHYAPVLYGIICRNTNDQEQSEDLLQRCFIEIWKKRLEYDPSKTRIFCWVIGICQKMLSPVPETISSTHQFPNHE